MENTVNTQDILVKLATEVAKSTGYGRDSVSLSLKDALAIAKILLKADKPKDERWATVHDCTISFKMLDGETSDEAEDRLLTVLDSNGMSLLSWQGAIIDTYDKEVGE